MAALINKILSFRSSDSPINNLQFDAVVAGAAALSNYLHRSEGFFQGLQVFSLVSLADRVICKMSGLGFKLPINSTEPLAQGICLGVVSAVLETGLSYLTLTTHKTILYTGGRLTLSFAWGITASRAIRHQDPNKQDLIDAALGCGWAILREVVIQKTSPRTAVIFAVVTNSLIFGAIESKKLPSHKGYKFLSSAIFSGMMDLSALNLRTFQYASFIPALTAHSLFNISRSLRS